MTESLICPHCRATCFVLHEVPAGHPGVFTNRRESQALAEHCPDADTAPCGRRLMRIPGETAADEARCDYQNRSP